MSLADTLFGRRLASWEESEQKMGILAGVPSLGLDALSSSAYGPEAALTILLPLGALGLRYIGPITVVILFLLGILYFSYRQTIAAYPSGGGAYTVARQNLGVRFGLLAAAALMLDYTLNVAVGISAGVEAIISAFPALHRLIVPLCLVFLALITIVNLRGVREAGAIFALPAYLFVVCLFVVIVLGTARAVMHGGHPTPVIAPPHLAPAAGAVSVWLLLRAFASGCTAMTGVEAVSNGVTAFADPTVKNAQGALTAIVLILAVLLGGIAFLSRAFGVGAMDEMQPGYQSVISQIVQAVSGHGALYLVTQAGALSVLVLSANTSYAGFPRLCRLVAIDHYLPHAFALLGRRLVYTFGILFLTGLAGALLIFFHGITDRLIPLFAVGAFLAFTLSQSGMVVHWREEKASASSTGALVVNGLGAIATGCALAVILVAKFSEGAWITVIVIPVLVGLFYAVHRHYGKAQRVKEKTVPLDLSRREPPVVIIPVEDWNIVTERALEFGMRLTDDIHAVHVAVPDPGGHDEEGKKVVEKLRDTWAREVVASARAVGVDAPDLVVLDSPYRRISKPLLDYIGKIKPDCKGRLIAVIIPELVETSAWEWLLHNHRATALKASLLMLGDRNVIVINVPWYLDGSTPLASS